MNAGITGVYNLAQLFKSLLKVTVSVLIPFAFMSVHCDCGALVGVQGPLVVHVCVLLVAEFNH